MKRKSLSLLLSLMLLAGLAAPALAQDAPRDAYVMWDGQLTANDLTGEAFAALTETTVYQSDESPTGYYVTFRYYGPEETRVRIAGEWYYSEPIYSSQFTAAKVHPSDWYNGLILHTDDTFPVRPFNDMELNEETGYWHYTIPLASGTYCYQYLVGGTMEDELADTESGTLMADPQNLPLEREAGIEKYSQVLVPYDAEKQSLSPDYSLYQAPRTDGQVGTVRYELVPSESLGFENAIGVYLPYGYDPERADPYPVLYIGHGSAGFESNWMSQGMIPNITDTLIAEGLMQPTIVVSPNMRDAQGDWLTLDVEADGTPTGNFSTYLAEELIAYMEANYNVISDPSGRAFAGLSRGGMLTFAMFLAHPETYGYFYMMSGASETPGDYDLTREALKTPTVSMGSGIFDRLFFRHIHPTQKALSEAGIEFTNYYALGAHRWHIWRELYADLCTRVLWQ